MENNAATSQAGSGAEPGPCDQLRIVLTIAGFDPSSGAGITADLKVFAAHSLYGVAAATSLTVQSTAGVRRVQPVTAALLSETLACLAEDLPLAGIKIGMLAAIDNVDAVADFLESQRARAGLFPVVLDPVLRSSSGHALLDAAGTERLRTRLLPLVSCITPNVDELFFLAESRALEQNHSAKEASHAMVGQAASLLAQRYPGLGILATGGHLAQPDDCVLAPGLSPVWIPGEWVDTPATHGTGCSYSSALLCGLVYGQPLVDAAHAAKRYVTEALRAATPIGKGGGPMHHLYRLGAYAAYGDPAQPAEVKQTSASMKGNHAPEHESAPPRGATQKGIF